MRRIDHATMGIDVNGAGKNGFVSATFGTQTPGTVITPQFMNDLQEELINVVLAAGLTPSSSRTQLADAIAIAATGSASANAVSIRGTSVLASPAPTNGMVIQHNGTSYLPGLVTNTNVSASAAIAVTKLAAGTNGQILKNVGTTPTWGVVDTLQGNAVSNAVPSSGYPLAWSGAAWAPAQLTNSGIAGGAQISASKLAVAGQRGRRLSQDVSNTTVGWYDELVSASALSGLSQNFVVSGIDQARFVMITPSGGAVTLGGLTITSIGGITAKILMNWSNTTVTLVHQDTGSLAANRFYMITGADLVIGAYKFVTLMHNGSWQVFTP